MPSPNDMPRNTNTRRGNRRGPCSREGCTQRKAPGGKEFCSFICRVMTYELAAAEEFARAGQGSPAATEYWVAAVEMNDALTRYRDLAAELARWIHSREQ